MSIHKLYGLSISSDLPLPLPVSSGPAELLINRTPLPASATWGNPDEWDVVGTPDDITFYWVEAGIFNISKGSKIRYTPSADADEAILIDTLLGEAAGSALLQRGDLIIHASAVEVDGQAWMFAGDSGSGKSTHATYLLSEGHALISDDLCIIRMIHNIPHVFPGPGQVNLWPDTLDEVNIPEQEYPIVFNGATKRAMKCQSVADPVPIQGVFVLESGESYDAAELTGAEAIIALLEHTFSSHLQRTYSFPFLNGKQEQQQLEQITGLIEGCSLMKLMRPERLDPEGFRSMFWEIR